MQLGGCFVGDFSSHRRVFGAAFLGSALSAALLTAAAPASAAEFFASTAIFTNRPCAADAVSCTILPRNYTAYAGGYGQSFSASALGMPGGATASAAVTFGDGYLPIVHAASTAGDLTRTGASTSGLRSFTYTGDVAIDLALNGMLHYVISKDEIPGDAPGEGFLNVAFGIMPVSAFDGLGPSSTAEEIVSNTTTAFPDCSYGAIAAGGFTSAGTSGENFATISLDTACGGGAIRLNPGDRFVVISTLQAISNRGGFTDASHTFSVTYDTAHTYYAGTHDVVSPDVFRSITSNVPEPGTWAMMILGFGLLGASLRQRQRLA